MFGVFDNNKPASVVGFPRMNGRGWKSHIFGSFKDAQAYMKEWLGAYSEGIELVPNVPQSYNGDDMIEIRVIPIHPTHNENCACLKSNWQRDDIQFPRLLAEINAIGLTVDQMQQLSEAMDLTLDEIDELFDRATEAWEKA